MTTMVWGHDPATPAGAAGLPVRAAVALLTVVVLGLAGAGAWRATGGRWAVIETPSMGTAIPVGSLILTRPRPVEHVHVGDVVTYRPPNLRELYTHRVVRIDPDGRLVVQGDLNGTADPFPVTQDMLVGEVVGHWRGLGWLLRALPTVLLALVVLAGITHLYVSPRWRSSVRVVGTCLVLGVSSLLLRPFVHPVLVATTTAGPDGALAGTTATAGAASTLRATVVSTGMLPTRITGAGGQHVDLMAGQVGSVPVAPASPGGPVVIDGTAHLTGWWLVGVGLVCLLPLLWVLVVGLAPTSATGGRPRTGSDGPPGA